MSTVLSASYIMTQSKRLAALKKRCPYPGAPGPLQMHQWAMYAGAASLLYSLRVIYRQKEAKGKKHLQTVHAKLGVASVIGIVTMALATTGLLKAPPASKATTKSMWSAHVNLGRAGLVAMGAAVASGAYSVFGNSTKFQAIVGGLAVAIGAVEVASLQKRSS
jgi:hypothetical protein